MTGREYYKARMTKTIIITNTKEKTQVSLLERTTTVPFRP